MTDTEIVSSIKRSIVENGDYNAPVVVVICGCPDLIPWKGDDVKADCCAAIENMLIAATAMELGSVWIGGFDPSSIRKILDIPDTVSPIGVVYFGYPAEQREPRTKYSENAVYWQKCDPERGHRPRPRNMVSKPS